MLARVLSVCILRPNHGESATDSELTFKYVRVYSVARMSMSDCGDFAILMSDSNKRLWSHQQFHCFPVPRIFKL
jgi:hypothetical protein